MQMMAADGPSDEEVAQLIAFVLQALAAVLGQLPIPVEVVKNAGDFEAMVASVHQASKVLADEPIYDAPRQILVTGCRMLIAGALTFTAGIDHLEEARNAGALDTLKAAYTQVMASAVMLGIDLMP